LTTVGTPARVGEGVVERGDPLLRQRRVRAVPRRLAEPPARAARSASSRGRVDLLGRHRGGDLRRQLGRSRARAGADGDHRDLAEPVGVEQRRTSSSIARRRPPGTVSMWLSTTSITSWWVASGAR
jgi:hypothetical protein